MSDFSESIESFRRTLAATADDKKLAVFQLLAREGIRWHTIRGMPKPDVIDPLRDSALETGLQESDVQAALEAAVEDPFVPQAPTNHAPKVMSAADQSKQQSTELVIRRVSDIEPQPVRWLWPNRLPLGKVTVVAGEPGLGKSQLTCSIAAAVTTGSVWPFDEGTAPSGSVIILSAEDDAADTIRPRLEAAGADLSRVYIISAVKRIDGKGRRSFSLQEDLKSLEAEVERICDVALIVIDPVSSYLGKVDSHNNADLRAVLDPLGEMAARLSVGVLAVTHFNKSGAGSANNRIIGSIALVAAARAAYVVVRDKTDKDRRLFLPSKNNVGPEGTGLSFRSQVLKTTNDIFAPAVVWEGQVTISADEALAVNTAKPEAASAREEAEDFLRAMLAEKPLPVRQIKSEATKAGVSWATLKRAKDSLGIRTSKTALDGGWVWELPHGSI